MKQDEIADRVSKSRSAITNSLRLLKLCDKVQQMIIDEKRTMGHVRPLIGIEDSEEQYQIAQRIFDERLTVRAVSYTHLDVYKRQFLYFWFIWSSCTIVRHIINRQRS